MDCRRLPLEKGLHEHRIALQRDPHLVEVTGEADLLLLLDSLDVGQVGVVEPLVQLLGDASCCLGRSSSPVLLRR
jgi:hypothetical protein